MKDDQIHAIDEKISSLESKIFQLELELKAVTTFLTALRHEIIPVVEHNNAIVQHLARFCEGVTDCEDADDFPELLEEEDWDEDES